MGQLVRLDRRGFGEVEGETSAAVRRVPLPASVALRILRLGLDTPSATTIRACACLVVQFLWFARADTGIHLCKRVFITNVKGTFFGMSESEEASKRR